MAHSYTMKSRCRPFDRAWPVEGHSSNAFFFLFLTACVPRFFYGRIYFSKRLDPPRFDPVFFHAEKNFSPFVGVNWNAHQRRFSTSRLDAYDGSFFTEEGNVFLPLLGSKIFCSLAEIYIVDSRRYRGPKGGSELSFS